MAEWLDRWRGFAQKTNPNMKVIQEKPEDKGAFVKAIQTGLNQTPIPRVVNTFRDEGAVEGIKELSSTLQKGLLNGAVNTAFPTEKPRAAPSNLSAVSTPPVRELRGGFVGARTDAEAARNLQARFEQDAAASKVAAGYDRATERLRDVRAEKLGISRESLDQYEGRSQAPQAAPEQKQFNPFELPGDERGAAQQRQQELISAATDPRAARKDRALAIQTLNSFLGRSAPAQQKQQQGVDPVDMNRFLLDQQKFGYQQQNDQQRLKLDMAGLENETAKTRLENQKYLGEERKAFMDNFSYPDENAPREQIGAGIWQMSQASGIPPEMLMGFVQRKASELNIDWKNGPPTVAGLQQLLEEAFKDAAKASGR